MPSVLPSDKASETFSQQRPQAMMPQAPFETFSQQRVQPMTPQVASHGSQPASQRPLVPSARPSDKPLSLVDEQGKIKGLNPPTLFPSSRGTQLRAPDAQTLAQLGMASGPFGSYTTSAFNTQLTTLPESAAMQGQS